MQLESDRQPMGGRPRQAVSACSAARSSGDRASARRIRTPLSMTPTPLTLSICENHISESEMTCQRPNRVARDPAQKIWERHVVYGAPDEPDLLYIDLHLVHEVTSPQAFEGCGWPGARCAGPS